MTTEAGSCCMGWHLRGTFVLRWRRLVARMSWTLWWWRWRLVCLHTKRSMPSKSAWYTSSLGSWWVMLSVLNTWWRAQPNQSRINIQENATKMHSDKSHIVFHVMACLLRGWIECGGFPKWNTINGWFHHSSPIMRPHKAYHCKKT